MLRILLAVFFIFSALGAQSVVASTASSRQCGITVTGCQNGVCQVGAVINYSPIVSNVSFICGGKATADGACGDPFKKASFVCDNSTLMYQCGQSGDGNQWSQDVYESNKITCN